MTAVPKPRVPKLSNAVVTARKGLCYLTIRQFGRNHGMMRIRAYKIDPEEKRFLYHARARANPGRLVTASEQVSSSMRSGAMPVASSAPCCRARFCSAVDTRM